MLLYLVTLSIFFYKIVNFINDFSDLKNNFNLKPILQLKFC